MCKKTIPGKIVTLKLLEPAYFEYYHEIFSAKVRKILDLPEVASVQETKDFLTTKVQDMKEGKTIFYCILDKAENKLIGAIEIREPGFAKGQLGSWLNEQYWGGGRYQEALDLIIREYFACNDADTVNAHIKKDNVRSLKAHQKYGFKIIKEFTENGKTFYDLVVKRP